MRQAALALTVSVALVTATGLAGAAGAERAGGVAPPIPDGRAVAPSRLGAIGPMAERAGAGAGVRAAGLAARTSRTDQVLRGRLGRGQLPSRVPKAAGLWISSAELARLPMSGEAWARMKAAADGDLGTPTLAALDASHDVKTLAVALVYARTGDVRYRQKAAAAIRAVMGSEKGGLVIMVARSLVDYVIAADLIDLHAYNPALDGQFRDWLSALRHEQFPDGTLISEDEARANNHGTMAGASRLAIAVYLGDGQELARIARVFRGWLGDRAAYAGCKYEHGLVWQADPLHPVAIEPPGAAKLGHSLDGAMPEEMRRGHCGFRWPPCPTDYPWEGLQGAVVQAMILSRQGYDVWDWQDRALLGAVQFLASLQQQYGGWWATGDDTNVPWLINHVYGTRFPTSQPDIGANLGWADWLYGPASPSARPDRVPPKLTVAARRRSRNLRVVTVRASSERCAVRITITYGNRTRSVRRTLTRGERLTLTLRRRPRTKIVIRATDATGNKTIMRRVLRQQRQSARIAGLVSPELAVAPRE